MPHHILCSQKRLEPCGFLRLSLKISVLQLSGGLQASNISFTVNIVKMQEQQHKSKSRGRKVV